MLVRPESSGEFSFLILGDAFSYRVMIFLISDCVHFLTLSLCIKEIFYLIPDDLLFAFSITLTCNDSKALQQEMIIHVCDYLRVHSPQAIASFSPQVDHLILLVEIVNERPVASKLLNIFFFFICHSYYLLLDDHLFPFLA